MKVLLIPSATLISREMRLRMGMIPACLFPLGERTMLEHIYRKYSNNVDATYVLANREEEQILDYIELHRLPIHVVHVPELRDLGYTIRCGLEKIKEEKVEQVYINFADTLLSNPPCHEQRDIVYYAKQEYDEDWSYFEQENGSINQIIDKQNVSNRLNQNGNVFVGVFELTQPMRFMDELTKAQEECLSEEDSFFTALKAYSHHTPLEFFMAGKWFDVGHSDKYIQAKTGVETRYFNSIEVDNNRGRLKKTSENKVKLIHEIKWFLKLPPELQYLTPRIYDYSLDPDKPFVSMEYYGYNTLHEMLVYGGVSGAKWRKYFERLLSAVEDLGQFQVKGKNGSISTSLEKMYIEKTVERLEQLRTNSLFSRFFDENIQINGVRYPSLNMCISELPKLLRKRLIDCAPETFCIIHGDLCFSNILVENHFGFIRMIDPRGKFGDFDIYGDPRYEIAKLMHSLDGLYDFIIEDMFSVQVDETRIILDFPKKANDVYLIFKDVFKPLLKDYADLKLIESTLFLSMLPLHSDFPNRQYAMLATGLRLMKEAIGGNING